MSTIGQVRRMLRIQALEAAKREDYRTRTRVQKIYIKDKITLVVIVMIIIAVYFKDRELFKSQIFNLFTTGEFIILLTPIINTLLIIYGVYRAIQITTKNDRE